MSVASTGARPCSTARSSISGLRASITTRTSFLPATTAGCASPGTSCRPARDRGGLLGRSLAALERVGDHGQDQHEQQEPRALEEVVLRAGEVDAVVAASQGSGEQRGQERANAGRAGEAGPLTDVEEEGHG